MASSFFAQFPLGVRFMLLSALGFALMTACVKYLGEQGIPLFEIVAARAVVSFIISYLDIKRKGISVWGNNKRLLLCRGIAGTCALVCVYYATVTLPLAEATILQYVHPVFTALLALFVLKERPQLSTIICILLCLIGVFAMVQPTLSSDTVADLPLFSVFVALGGAFCSAVAYVIVRKLSQTEDASVIIFYFPLVALPVSLILMGDNFIWPDLYLTTILILLGLFTQVGQLGLTKAMHTETAGKASAYAYIQIVFSILLGMLLFGELPSEWTYLGGSLIVVGALINVFGHRFKWLRS